MRKIKFRGYNRKNKQWIYGFYLQNRGHHFVCSDKFAPKGNTWEDYEVDPETVGQYLCKKDRCNQPVYEGDIVFDDCNLKEPAVVIYNEKKSEFDLRYKDGLTFGLYDCKDKEIEIIGNIHDNPELLEQREQCELAKTLPSRDKSQQS